MTQGAQDHIDHQNAKIRRQWWKNNKSALFLCFAIAVGADQTNNVINRGFSTVSGMPTNSIPYTTQLVRKGWNQIQRAFDLS